MFVEQEVALCGQNIKHSGMSNVKVQVLGVLRVALRNLIFIPKAMRRSGSKQVIAIQCTPAAVREVPGWRQRRGRGPLH